LKVAGDGGLAPVHVVLARVLRNPVISASIVGATTIAHLADAIAAIDLRLDHEEATALEAQYLTHPRPGY
jgi:1-deoxyxylulose-5-phosphate synthase